MMYVEVLGSSRTGGKPKIFYYYYYGRVVVGTRYYMLMKEGGAFGIVNMNTSTWSWFGGFEQMCSSDEIERHTEIVY